MDCLKRIRDEKNNPKNHDSDNGEATITANNSNMGEFLVVSTQNHKEDWILDSGCTFHMCPTKDWFKEYKEIDGGKVLMGNKIACQIVGIGNISIRMFDGLMKILSRVRHAPNLHRNLISIGALDESGSRKKVIYKHTRKLKKFEISILLPNIFLAIIIR
ncbi:hypothetical protein UlMin_028385 [Ulmus minor]